MINAAVSTGASGKASAYPRVLFIARAYPPTLGGMENLAFRLREQLASLTETTSIINLRGKRALPAFLPYAAAAAIRRVRAGSVDIVHLADALLAPAGAVIKAATGAPVTSSVCGLDVTYRNPVYQAVVPRALSRLDAVMPISGSTCEAMRSRTGPSPEAHIIPLGINPLPSPTAESLAEFDRQIAAPGRPVVLTVGRLVRRKGVAWFTRNVMPLLPAETVYAVVGDGKERNAILAAAEEAGVADRLRLLGRVDDGVLAAAYARTTVFVMPNIPVPGDMEGFGLVALEAAANGLPVVASDLEGITEAVIDGENGMLVPPLDPQLFAQRIRHVLALSEDERAELARRLSAFTMRQYGWETTAQRYLDVMRAVVGWAHPASVRAASRAQGERTSEC